jgi:SAM-dependent methyltransferase
MELAGDQVKLTQSDADLLAERLCQYHFAENFVKDRTALDLGGGGGYGAAILAKSARMVFARHGSSEVAAFPKRGNTEPNVRYLVSDLNHLPLSTESVDVVVCFDLIEHLAEHDSFFQEIVRVVRPEGVVIVSTPNRACSPFETEAVRPLQAGKLDVTQFSTLLKNYFRQVDIDLQNRSASIYIGDANLRRGVHAHLEQSEEERARTSNHLVAVCSNGQSSQVCSPLVYLPSIGNLVREKDRTLRFLELRARELDRKVLQQQEDYERQSRHCQELNRLVQEKTEWAMRLDENIKTMRARLAELQERLPALKQEFLDRTEQCKQLSVELSLEDRQVVSLVAEFDERTAYALRLNDELKRTVAARERIKQQLLKINESKAVEWGKAKGWVPKSWEVAEP